MTVRRRHSTPAVSETIAEAVSRTNQTIHLWIEAGIFAGCLLVLAVTATSAANPHLSVVAAAMFFWMIVLSLRLSPRGTILLIPFIISSASSMVALVMIEYGAEIPELGMMGLPNGSTSTYVVYTTICFWFFLLSFNWIVGSDLRSIKQISLLFDRYATPIALGILAIGALSIAYLMLAGLKSGFPLLTGADRYAYRRFSADIITLYLLNLKATISIILGMVSFLLPVSRLLKLASTSIFICLSLVFFLFGEKFFTQLLSLATFMTPYLYHNHKRLLQLLPVLLIGGGLALVAVSTVTWFIYSNGGRENPHATMQRLSGRMVGQGELWFLQNQIGARVVNWDSELVEKNARALFVKDINLFAVREGVGPSYFSNRYAPDKIRASILRNAGSVTYAAALEALGLAAFGWAGLILVMIFTGGVIALSSAYLVYAIRLRSVVSCVFAMYIISAVRSYVSQGALWQIIGIYSLKWFAVIFVIELGLMLLNSALKPSAQMNYSRI